MDNKPLTLLPLNFLPQKALNEIEIAKQLNLIPLNIFNGNKFYYSKEFGIIKIFRPTGIKLNKFNISNKIKQIDITVINPDNLNPKKFKSSDFILQNMENIAEKMTQNKDMGYAYISTDSLPGYKIIANTEKFESYQGDLIYTKEYGILFVQVLDVHGSNYEKIEGNFYRLRWYNEKNA